MKKLLLVSSIVVLALTLAACKKNQPISTSSDQTQTQNQSSSSFQFQNPKKSAHWESNTPEHGSTLAGVPVNVVINFNFDLAKPSNISITKDSKEYGVGETIIDPNKLTLRRNMDSATPDGLYTINYKACWPDGSCHDGSFQFAIDRTSASSYEDMTGQTNVSIDLKNIMFEPKNIKIAKDTKVTWTNNDSVSHYVNTDSHPAHTYQADQNSGELRQGDSFTYTFDKAGIYPYHCSAHAGTMTANIIVI